MGFRIIRAEERVARMVQWFSGICKQVTDFLPGSKTRTKFEALAIELEAQDFAFYQAAKKAIPTAIYQAFSFELIAAQKASDSVVFTAAGILGADLVIPAGTKVATEGSSTNPEKLYITTAPATILAGQTTASAPIVCSVAGTTGNTAANSITVIKQTLPGIASVTNPTALRNGSDKESEAERRVRFIEYIASLRRGTNEAIAAGAKTATLTDADGTITERVKTAFVNEEYSADRGDIACYIFNGTGNTSDALVARTQEVIDGYVDANGTKVAGYKAAGIICTVLKATEVAPDIAIDVVAGQNVDQAALKLQVEGTIKTYLEKLNVGQSILRSEIIQRVKGITGVYDCTLVTPAANLAATPSQVFTPFGTITATVT